MNRYLYIPALAFVCFALFGANTGGAEVCGLFRNKKSTDALFQDLRTLSLHCDATFTFRHTNCIHPETSFGTWTIHNNLVTLSVTDKVKRLARKEKKTKEGYRYINLDGATLTLDDSIITWKHPGNHIDTLYRQ